MLHMSVARRQLKGTDVLGRFSSSIFFPLPSGMAGSN